MKYLQDTDNVVALKAIQDLPVKLYTRYNYLVKKHAKNIDGRKSYWLIAWKAFELYFVEIQKIKEARGKGNKLDSFSLHFFTKQFWNKYIEPWFVDLLDNVVSHTLQEFLRGLRSDN